VSTLSGRKLLGLTEEGLIWQAMTVVSGISLLIALIVLLVAAMQHEKTEHES